MATTDNSWHLDKRVPITLIFTLIVQSSVGVWWAAGLTERMGQIERRQTAQGVRSEQADETLAEQSRRIAVLSEALANTNRNLERVNGEIANTNALLREFLLNHNGALNNGTR